MNSREHRLKNGNSRRYLFAGACGMGMAPMAIYLKEMGHEVVAIDDYPDPKVRRMLEVSGVVFADSPFDVLCPDEVVMSRALEHEGRRAVELRNLFPEARFLFRGECLAELAHGRRLLAVAGSHGKTTTTAMAIQRARCRGLSIDWILGGLFASDAVPCASFSGSEWLVAEIDESDGTIEGFDPEVTVITNLDWDHVDCYQSEQAILESFFRLGKRTRSHVVLSEESSRRLDRHLASGSWTANSEWVERDSDDFNAMNWRMAGVALDKLAEFTNGSPEDRASFVGVERRQHVVALDPTHTMVLDYAHHPTELSALHEWARAKFPEARISWVFQPHRYSRTRHLLDEFAEVLGRESSILLPEYAAFEGFQPGGDSVTLASRIREVYGVSCPIASGPGELVGWMKGQGSRAAVWLFAGAGDIDKWAEWVRAEWSSDVLEDAWLKLVQGYFGMDSKLSLHEPMAKKLTLNVGGRARYYAEPECSGDLILLCKTAKLRGIPIAVVGRGSNLLMADEGFDGLVIRLSQPFWRRINRLGDGRVWVRSGVPLRDLARKAGDWGLSGFEFAEGIPGSVGGAIRMNAGAMGREMSDVLDTVEYLTDEHRILRLGRSELEFRYRDCPTLRGSVVLGAVLKGAAVEDSLVVKARMADFAIRRKSTQPLEPSAGCLFRNPPGGSAGRLIDVAGLKGLRVGDAMISEVHGNFLVNLGHARSADVEALIREVRDRVWECHQVALEMEIHRLGEEGGRMVGETQWDEFNGREER